jgi:hypothetical protein
LGRKKRKKRSPWPVVAVGAVVILVAFSLAVRWLGVGNRAAVEHEDFQIEVLNGTGETGLAMRTAMGLRLMGIDVLVVGNAGNFNFQESLLIDRRGNPRLMKKLSRLTGCRRVLQQIQSDPLVDATLIIGEDHESLKISEGT